MEDNQTKFYNDPTIDPYTNKSITLGSKRFNQLVEEFGSPKMRSPKTGRMIAVGGATYNKLSTIHKQEYLSKINPRLNPNLPTEIVFEEILMHMDNPDFMSLCKTNKEFNKLCKSEQFWKLMYEKYYNDSGMKTRLPDATYLELFKICYNLHFIQLTFGEPISISHLYNSVGLNIYSNHLNNKKFVYALQFMHNLKSITIYVKDLSQKLIPNGLDQLPFLEQVIFEKK